MIESDRPPRDSFCKSTCRIVDHSYEKNQSINNMKPSPSSAKSEIAFILDRSGSMSSMSQAAIDGFNEFLQGQQQTLDNDGHPLPADFTLILFDHEYLPAVQRQPIAEVKPLSRETFQPRGNTALLDAIGRTIDELGAKLAAMPEGDRPRKVIIAILTDGHENSSRHYSLGDVHEKIRHQTDVYAWEFLFLAANQDAIAAASAMGIESGNVSNFVANEEDMHYVQQSISEKISVLRKLSASVDLDACEKVALKESMHETLLRKRAKK